MHRLLKNISHRISTFRNADASRHKTQEHQTDFRLPSISLSEMIGHRKPQPVSVLSSHFERPRDMVLPLPDLIALAAICRVLSPSRVLEIGTFTGETTWTMSHNLPHSSEILTLDLPPAEIPSHFQKYTAGEAFLGTPEADRITQLYGWSERFDFSPFFGTIDLMFIDGDHTCKAVQSDTQQALKLVKRGGVILWDDYRFLPCHIGCRGVSDYLHSVASQLPVRQLLGTRLAVMRVV